MSRIVTRDLKDGPAYRATMLRIATLLASVRSEVARVEGISAKCQDDQIEEGRQHRLKCLAGHQRALKDAAAHIEVVRGLLKDLTACYLEP